MLLTEGIKQGYVIPTEYTRKLTIDGHTESYQVYKIRLDQLFYNDQNDRIATWISKYKAENHVEDMDTADKSYNDLIENFIYESNPKAIDKTKSNIELVGQREAGVVLNDGRIIDGNRRYTCLRQLHEKNSTINHFEAVILERDIQENKKEIKLLELSIQHGEDGKGDYNPIDRLVGLYNDVIKNEFITFDEYQKTVNESAASLNKKIEQAKLMVEFLEFINAPEQFYIARDLELDGPLAEVPSLLKRVKTEDEKENLKLIIFSNLAMKPQGDITRFVRKIKNVVDSNHFEEFIEEQLEYAESTLEKLEDLPEITTKEINTHLRSDEELKNQMKASVEKFEIKTKKDSTRTKPIQDLQRCQLLLSSIDYHTLSVLNDSEKELFLDQLKKCEDEIQKVKNNFEMGE